MQAKLETRIAKPDGVQLGGKWADRPFHQTPMKTFHQSAQHRTAPVSYMHWQHTATDHLGLTALAVLIEAFLPRICNLYLLHAPRILICLWGITCK
jgi:hypothetical protein